jgi:hypothetical protein
MPDGDWETTQMLHQLYHPLLRRVLEAVHPALQPWLDKRRGYGWRSRLTSRLEAAFRQFVRDLEGTNPDLAREAEAALDLVLILSELEVDLFPRWLEGLLNCMLQAQAISWNDKVKKLEVEGK